MKIGIDVRSVQESAIHRGIGKYTTNLLIVLAEIDTENDYYFFLYPHQASFAQSVLPHGTTKHFIFLPPSRFRHRKFIRTVAIGNETLKVDSYGLDVVLQLDVLFPISRGNTPVVSVVYDLIPFLFRTDYQQPVRLRYKTLAGLLIFLKEKRLSHIFNNSLRVHERSDEVIAISAHTARDLCAATQVKPEKIHAIPLGADTLTQGVVAKKPSCLPANKPFVFYVGGIDPRKQVPLLIEQFSTLQHPELKLVIAGKEAVHMGLPGARKIKSTITRLGLDKKVVLTGYASDEELTYLYHHAEAFVFPSAYEGFGLPVLEAFLSGCPVIAYANSSIPEVAGDAALLVGDGESLAPAIQKVLDDRTLRADLIKKGKARAAHFTWKRTAEETLAVLKKAATS